MISLMVLDGFIVDRFRVFEMEPFGFFSAKKTLIVKTLLEQLN